MKSKKLLLLLLVLAMTWSSQMAMAQTVVYDDSDGPFTILAQMVTVLTPNGGENWNGGEAHDIIWSLDASVTHVNIDYSINGGYDWTPVAASIANTGSYTWTVPDTPSLNCLVRVSAAGNAGNNDISNEVFYISASSLESITVPNRPSGPNFGVINASYSFVTGGATSSLWHDIQYKFDWGDGTDSGWLEAGATLSSHNWSSVGNYSIRAMARCAIHTGLESPWSETFTIIISDNSTPVLLWNTFLGNEALNEGYAIASDGNRNIYVTGKSSSTWGSPLFPFAGGEDAFVAKLNANGEMQWHTFLGGSGNDISTGIALDINGNIVVTGTSYAAWGSPLRAFSGSVGTPDAFVAKLDASGTRLWHTFLGGSKWDCGISITIDGSNNILMTGFGYSSWGSPINPHSTYAESNDGVLVKLNTDGSIQWLTFFGAIGAEKTTCIALDNNGNIVISGYSDSNWGAPWGNPLKAYSGGETDAFLVKFNADGAGLWHTFLGGGKYDKASDVDVDNSGNIFVTGYSTFTWGSPLIPYSAGSDGFLAKLNTNGALQWNTFVGGSGADSETGIIIDGNGCAMLMGSSDATWGNPIMPHNGGNDTYLVKFDISGNRQWNTFIGGTGADYGGGILLDSGGNAVVAGWSDSTWGSPISPFSGNYDVFVAKLGFITEDLTVTSPNGGENWNCDETRNITWIQDGSITSVNIDYSINGGSDWTPIAANITNSSSFAWIVPNFPSLDCLIRVSAVSDAANYDISDAVFFISASSLENVTTPTQPTGPNIGTTITNYSFSSGGATSSLGHNVQYKFEWGDGTDSDWLEVGTTSADHAWTASGTYQVRAMARCATHTSVESPWSEAFTVTISDSSTPVLLWNTFLGGSKSDKGQTIAIDNSGNIYLIGTGSSTWGIPLCPWVGLTDAFVAKFNADGVLLWHTFLGNFSSDNGYGICFDLDNNVYITGISSMTWGNPLSPHSTSGDDSFVAKLNTYGELQWNTFVGRTPYGNSSIAIDNNKNIYLLAGSYLVKYNDLGEKQWEKLTKAVASDGYHQIVVDNSGNAFIASSSQCASCYAAINPYAGGVDAIVIKYSSDGTELWYTFMGGSGNDYGSAIALDSSGNIFVSGFSYQTWGSPLNPGTGLYVAKLDANGERIWHAFPGSSGGGKAVTTDNNGNIYATGLYAWVYKLSTNGSLHWQSKLDPNAGNTGMYVNFYGIHVENDGQIAVAGDSSYSWGNPINSYSGNYDAFVAKLGAYASELSVISPNGGENWEAGLSHYITWSLVDSITSIKIDYSIDSGNNWIPVTSGTPNNGAYKWTVPATFSTSCLVRVSDANNADVYDVSNAPFSISVPTVETVTVPLQPSGPDNCLINTSYSFSTGGSISWLGDDVQYKFDWDDGSDSGWLPVGITAASHVWVVGGIYNVRAMARCAIHPSIESLWSEKHVVSIPQTTPLLQWNTFLGDITLDEGYAITTDSSGNIYMTGKSTSTWGNPLYPFSGNEDAFVAKLNANGILQWHTFLGGSSGDEGKGILVDNEGNIFITGHSGSTWGSPLRAFSGSSDDGFVAKLNASGERLWHTFLGGLGTDQGFGIVVDNNGNIYATGKSTYTWGIPINPHNGINKYSGFLVRLDAGGALQWLTFFGEISFDGVNSITLDRGGDIYIVGHSGVTWGSPLNPYTYNTDAYVVKFNANGTRLWNTFLGGGESWDKGYDIAVDNSGNIFIVGNSGASWGIPINPSAGSDEAFLVKLNSSGIREWHTFFGGMYSDQGTGIAMDTSGNIYVTGWSGTTWGNPLNPHAGSSDAFVVKYNFNGTLQWNTFMGGTGADYGYGIALDNSGNVYVTGNSPATWGSPLRPYSGSTDAFVARLGFTGDNLSVITPNGGENWMAGSVQNITWSTSGSINKINIDYSIDSGNVWTSVATNISNSGSYSWTVPTTPSTNCLVRVSDAADGNPTDSSNATFTISAVDACLTVTSPNGGEQWQRGITQLITWASAGVANIKIELMKGTKRNATLTSSFPASGGSFSWAIPATQTVGSDYTIRVTSTSDSSIVDSSDASFTIFAPIITVTAPTAGAAWQRGITHTITWTWEGTMDASVKILLYKGTKLNSTLSTDTPNDGSFDWTIPANQVLATTYKIRIATVDGLVTADSGTFSITDSAGLILTSPNNGETLPVRTIFPVRWTVDPTVSAVKLEYSRDNGGTFFLIGDGIPNAGYYEWDVPVNFTTNGIVRVSDSYGRNWYDENGVLETIFSFDCKRLEMSEHPEIIVWHGRSNLKSPGYEFAKVEIGLNSIRMGEISQAIDPLSSGWHEVKIRLDLKRDQGALFIDSKSVLENVALYTTMIHHFEPYLTIRSGGGTGTELILAGLRVQMTLISDDGNETDHFTIMNEDFSVYNDRSNTISSCWQVMGLKPSEPALGLKNVLGWGRVLWLRNVAGSSLTISKPLSIPENIPFDISDRSFSIEMREMND